MFPCERTQTSGHCQGPLPWGSWTNLKLGFCLCCGHHLKAAKEMFKIQVVRPPAGTEPQSGAKPEPRLHPFHNGNLVLSQNSQAHYGTCCNFLRIGLGGGEFWEGIEVAKHLTVGRNSSHFGEHTCPCRHHATQWQRKSKRGE